MASNPCAGSDRGHRVPPDRRSAVAVGVTPPELLRLPEELARVDALLDDPAFFAPFAPYFHPVLGLWGSITRSGLAGGVFRAGIIPE